MSQENNHVLLVALGGGGDVIAAAMLAQQFSLRGMIPIVVSLAWERFAKNPTPGPHRPSELLQIKLLDESLGQVTKETAFSQGVLTNQALLHAHLNLTEQFILNPHGGVVSLVAGLQFLKQIFSFQEAWGVDVGGDVLATHPLPTLRSPLSDAMMLAALKAVFPKAKVAVLGLGLDGELPKEVWQPEVSHHLESGMIEQILTLSQSTIEQVGKLLDARVLSTEATALVVRAYQGLRGKVMARDAGTVVEVNLQALPTLVYRANDIYQQINPIAKILVNTETIEQASTTIENLGYQSEWRIEHQKASLQRSPYPKQDESLLRPRISELLTEIAPHVDFVAERYIAHQLKASLRSVEEIIDHLSTEGVITSHPPFVGIQKLKKEQPQKKEKLFILLGAGASYGYGPTTQELTDFLMKWSPSNDKFKPFACIYRELHHFHQRRHSRFDGKDINFEHLYGMLEQLESFEANRIHSTEFPPVIPVNSADVIFLQPRTYLRRIRKNLKKHSRLSFSQLLWQAAHALLAEVVRICKQNEPKYSVDNKASRASPTSRWSSWPVNNHPLIKGLRCLAAQFDITIVSLNYDDLVGRGFQLPSNPHNPQRLEISMDSAFYGEGEKSFERFFRLSGSTPRKENEIVIRLCHLHGSVNFHVVGESNAGCRIKYLSTPLGKQSNREPQYDEYTQEKSLILPLITGLEKTKMLQVLPYRFYYNIFEREATAASKWLIIGYSGGDNHVNRILREIYQYFCDVRIPQEQRTNRKAGGPAFSKHTIIVIDHPNLSEPEKEEIRKKWKHTILGQDYSSNLGKESLPNLHFEFDGVEALADDEYMKMLIEKILG